MRLKCREKMFAMAILAANCFAASTSAMHVPRIELVREVRVTGVNVLLSDLLPQQAGDSLRALAGEISLGAAPEPGTTRVLARSGVLENIGERMDVSEEIAVPERMTVSRDARAISVQEVFVAIRNALELGGNSTIAYLRPEDVLFEAQILVGPGDAGLEVLRSDFDSGLKRGRFLLWPSHDPKVLPFFVAVRFVGNSPVAALHSASEVNRIASKPEAPPVPGTLAKAEILVSPGVQATLIVQSAALRMMADVIPLERGTMGQQVRVRVVDTGKVFSAQVDGRAHLEVNF
jgi:flagellar basal body P-ring formation chaperone FlgA